MSFIKELIQNESGQGLVEYALILAFVAMAVVATLRTLGEHVIPLYENSELEKALSPKE